jgi:ATP-dependent protease ClpP protease subunit
MKSIYLSGIVGYEITADYIRSQINENSKEKLQVIVNSPGGFVIDAFEIYNIFNTYKGEVEFVINGMAASAMSYIIMAGDKISAFKNSIFMAHRAQAVGFGDADDIQREADIARAMDNVLAESYVGRMKKSKDQILAEMKNEIWLIGWEALTDSGIIDNVIDSPDEIEFPDEETKQQVIFTDEDLNKCGEPEKKKKAELAIMSCKNRMQRDFDRISQNSMKAAALLRTESTPEEKPVEDNIITEGLMTLQDFLKSNPDAQAEYDNALATARAQGEDSVRAEYSNDRKRIANILECSGVKMSDSAIEAIENNIDAGEFAQAELKRQKEVRANIDSSPFAALKPKAEIKDQVAVEDIKPEEIRAKVKASLAQLGGI